MSRVDFEPIPYQNFCWVLGTTTFRRADLNLVTEQQLIMLTGFRSRHLAAGGTWKWRGNKELQVSFYDFYTQSLSESGVSGKAKLKDKDARQQTSPLHPLGLATEDRVVTEAGNELVELAEAGEFRGENLFDIPADSYIYLKQLLKTSLSGSGDRNVRPYYVLGHLLNKFEKLTFEEFSYLLPMVNDKSSLDIITRGIVDLRAGDSSVNQIILNRLHAMESMREAHTLFMAETVTPELMMVVGMNRKSRSYDKIYAPIYEAAKSVFRNIAPSSQDVLDLDSTLRKLKGKPAKYWRGFLLSKASKQSIKSRGAKVIQRDCPLSGHATDAEFKSAFFWLMHLIKSLATLDDYADLNRRYFKLTDTILFEDGSVTFDVLPRAFFWVTAGVLERDMFTQSKVLTSAVDLEDIAPEFDVPTDDLLEVLSGEFGVTLTTLESANRHVRDERYERLHNLLDTRFTTNVLCELLDCFVKRNDARIAELVTDAATPSTVLEFVLGLCWYEMSERTGDVLDYMKLQLEADFMPRTHAQGGGADIVYEYPRTKDHPEHAMLIEATLANGTNARQMEMEPVSRHLGRQIIESGNTNDYCVFVAPQLDMNVVNDFRFRKDMGFFNPETGKRVSPLMIIPLDLRQVRTLLAAGTCYATLYASLKGLFDSPEMHAQKWKAEIDQEMDSISAITHATQSRRGLQSGQSADIATPNTRITVDRPIESDQAYTEVP